MQEKAIAFLNESSDKKQSEALKAASAEVSITTVMTTTTGLTTTSVSGLTASAPVIGMEFATPSMQSQQSTSSVVMVVAAATTPLMAGQIFHDFLLGMSGPVSSRQRGVSHPDLCSAICNAQASLLTALWVVPML
jgi:phosphohistidine swiveling domain-containing protein